MFAIINKSLWLYLIYDFCCSLAYPGPPSAPKIVSAFKDCINLAWTAPSNTGGTNLLGYSVEKRKNGSNLWSTVNSPEELIKGRQPNLISSLLNYNFCFVYATIVCLDSPNLYWLCLSKSGLIWFLLSPKQTENTEWKMLWRESSMSSEFQLSTLLVLASQARRQSLYLQEIQRVSFTSNYQSIVFQTPR